MNYELALELKDAGFPQKEGRSALYITPSGDVLPWEGFGGSEGNDYVYLPTLTDLIEACAGDATPILFQAGDKWWAANWGAGCFGDHYIDDSLEYLQEGSTPEEAVARLWLALHPKGFGETPEAAVKDLVEKLGFKVTN